MFKILDSIIVNSELGLFEDGCQPETSQTRFACLAELDLPESFKSLHELKAAVSKRFPSSCLLLDSCDEVGRLDVQFLARTVESLTPCNSKKDLDKWREGERELFAVCVSMQIVEEKPVSLLERKAIGYAYPSSIRAKELGFVKTGCFVIESGEAPIKQGFATLESVRAAFDDVQGFTCPQSLKFNPEYYEDRTL